MRLLVFASDTKNMKEFFSVDLIVNFLSLKLMLCISDQGNNIVGFNLKILVLVICVTLKKKWLLVLWFVYVEA